MMLLATGQAGSLPRGDDRYSAVITCLIRV